MPKQKQEELDLGLGPTGQTEPGLKFVGSPTIPLSPTQAEFNKLLGKLDDARRKLERKRHQLSQLTATVTAELFPLLAGFNRTNCNLIQATLSAFGSLRFSRLRRSALEDLILTKVHELIDDPLGLTNEDLDQLREIREQLCPGGDESAEEDPAIDEEFDLLRSLIEAEARRHGVELDLSDLDIHGDPIELARTLEERLGAAARSVNGSPPPPRRKPTKAQAERERRREEIAAAKQRDIKTLFKQLAKVLHPDLEPDPNLKQHREDWMKRLNSAFDRGDLREMLSIEMEWLGEEGAHLATVSEEKLKVYCLVLKEQITEIRQQTAAEDHDPRYEPLHRFGNPRSLRASDIPLIRDNILKETNQQRQCLATIQAGGPPARRLLNEWADEHHRVINYPFNLRF